VRIYETVYLVFGAKLEPCSIGHPGLRRIVIRHTTKGGLCPALSVEKPIGYHFAPETILTLEVTMGAQPGADPRVLQERAYADDVHLDVRRRTHQIYTVEPVDFGRWTLERLRWRGDERVLDVGCGPGELLREMARHQAVAPHQGGWDVLAGLDFSPGMIAQAQIQAAGLPVHFLVGDAQTLPFPDAMFDVVMARHMLYHVPAIDRAVAEAARVLRRGGQFLVTTNSAHTMPEYLHMRRRASLRFPAMLQSDALTDRFSLENGAAFLEPYFGRVETHTLRGILRFPAAEPFLAYFASSRAMLMRPDHSDAEWQAVADFVRAETEAVLARDGRFDVTKIAGALVGMKGP
jgi:ubiquinone/menaquinone biosynthesis C-methylase UbiE